MPLPKILAPLLPRYRSTRTIKDKDESNVKGFSLSPPGLPFSPPQLESSTTNDNGDPIIEVATEEDCNASSENVIPEALVDQEATENAVVLHQSPTSMKSYEENNVIELVDNEEEPAQKKGETIAESIGNEEETFDKDMMRDNTYVHSTTSNSSTAPEIDFAPPAEFMNEDMVLTPPPLLIDTTTEEIEATMVPSPDSLPNDNEVQLEETQYEFSTPIQAESTQPSEVAPYHPIEQEFIQPQAETITPVQDVFIKHIQQDIFMKPSQDIFAKPTPTKSVSNASESSYTESEPSEANFAMKTTFHKTDGVKSKWMKMLSSAKGLVCKPERIEENQRTKSVLNTSPEKDSTTAGQERYREKFTAAAIDTSFVSAYDKPAVEDEDAKTPIYRRCNTSSTSLFHLDTAQLEPEEPSKPHKSPVIGSDAYNIKLLCDQSFFGRW